jgi:tetratricopeptide (TPR) repeat protein
MHKFIRMWALVAVLMGTAAAASAATPSEFYLGLLRRGTAAYDASRYADAQKQLGLAAFGLVETVDQYQVAQVYLTLTFDKLSDPDRAREAAHRVFLAERVERKYAGLPLPAEVRTTFEMLANRLLSASESAMLLRGAPMSSPPPPPTQQRAATPTQTPPSTPSRTTTTVPQVKPQPAQTSASQTSTAQQTQPRKTIPEPRTTTPENTPPQTVTPTPQTTKPQAAPQTPKPVQTATQTATTPPRPTPAPAPTQAPKSSGTELDGRGGPVEPPRPAAAAPAPRTLTASEVATRLTAAERGLNTGNLNDARRAYRELLAVPGLDHETLVRIAEGLYRARDFSSALSAFNRVGTLRRGEEPYRYYIAVALYETGDFARAKKELAAALPYIEVTPDVARYRVKIEGSM